MKTIISLAVLALLISCISPKNDKNKGDVQTTFTIAFGSCNDQNLPNIFWDEILKNNPNVWIWGGDNIYADTTDMKLMESYYQKVKNNNDYKNFVSNVDIMGTWDDHDYGINDGGIEFIKKDSAQQLFLDFLDVEPNDSRRKRKGVYNSKTYSIDNKSVKIIILDTRYFRTALTKDPSGKKRYIPNATNNGTILGKPQWQWLEKELNTSEADFNVIVSSIQFLSHEHGFETWGNIPLEVDKLKNIILSSKAKRVLLLSGDRHISEISAINLEGLEYPIYDFTSSGLTHTYEKFISEPNAFRVSNVIKEKNFGLVKFDLQTNTMIMEIRGVNNSLLESKSHKY